MDTSHANRGDEYWRQQQQQQDNINSADEALAALQTGQLQTGQLHLNNPWGWQRDRDEGEGDMGGVDFQTDDLQVANEQGEVVGNYVPPEHLSVEQAYSRFVRSKEGPISQFDSEMKKLVKKSIAQLVEEGQIGRPAKRSRGRADKDVATAAITSLMGLDVSADASDEEEYAEELEVALCDPSSSSDTSDTAIADFSPDDEQYIINRFQKHLKHAELDHETLMRRLCPLCGFMNNQHDAISGREFSLIDGFADSGVGNMDPDTHAILLSFMWNKNIYEPMKRQGKRIAPLTAAMAKAHVTAPHRWNKRQKKLRDAQTLDKISDLLIGNVFRANPMTGEQGEDLKRLQLALKTMELKWKIVGTDDKKDPFNTASRGTAANVGRATNPLQGVRERHPKRRR